MAKAQKKKPAPPADDEVFQLRVALGPPPYCVWRRVLVPTRARLSDLHRVLQVVMGWEDSHAHQFEIDGKQYGLPSDDFQKVYDESKPSLASRLEVGDVFAYEYDFGDGWEHEIRVEAKHPRSSAQVYPICIGGRLACPPEDCGGLYGYIDIVDQLLDGGDVMDPERKERYGRYDPDAFSIDAVNRRLHGKKVAAPRDPTLDPRFDALASALADAVGAWWRAPDGADRARLEEARTLALSFCAALAQHEESAAQLAAVDELCAGRLIPWFHHLPVALARTVDLDAARAVLAAAPFIPTKEADGIRISALVAAGRPDDARAAIDALLATHGRDAETLMSAAFALEELADWSRVEAIARELGALPDADFDDRAAASALLVQALRELGRQAEADEIEAAGWGMDEEFEDGEFEDEDEFEEEDEDEDEDITRGPR